MVLTPLNRAAEQLIRERMAEEMRLSEGGVHEQKGNDAQFLG